MTIKLSDNLTFAFLVPIPIHLLPAAVLHVSNRCKIENIWFQQFNPTQSFYHNKVITHFLCLIFRNSTDVKRICERHVLKLFGIFQFCETFDWLI